MTTLMKIKNDRNLSFSKRLLLLAAICLAMASCKEKEVERPSCVGDCNNGVGKRYLSLRDNFPVDYEGKFVKGYLIGEGIIRWGNGVVYRGNVQWNVRFGQGIRTKPGEKPLEGMWANDHVVCLKGNCENGYGVAVFIDHDAMNTYSAMGYDGSYALFSGWQDWDEYRGNFKDWQLSGCGSVFRSGQETWGLWESSTLREEHSAQCQPFQGG